MTHYRIIKFLLFLGFSVSLSCSSQNSFQFAWLSDTHVSENGAGAEDLKAAVKDINQLKNVDFVIISGDVSEADWSNNLKKAKSILDALEKPYYIIPGNHDTKWSESGGQNFKRLWGDDKFVFDYGGYKFIGLSQGPILKMADGHFSPQDLKWLDATLVHLKERNQPLIFVTHYPIDSSVDNYNEFLDLIENYNLKMILHGHGHRNKMTSFKNIPGVMGRSSLKRKEEHGGYTLAEVTEDSIFFSERITGLHTKSIWGRLSLANDLPKSQNTETPENILKNKNSTVKLNWLYDAGYTITSSPVFNKNFVYSGVGNGSLICLNGKNGKLVWKFKTNGPVYASPAIESERLVFTSVDSFIYCLNSNNGRLLWKTKTDAPIVASPIIENDRIYFGGSDHIFRALSLIDGELVWEYEGVSGFVETKPLIYKNLIVFGAWDETLYALNKNSGDLEWAWRNGRPGKLYSPAACRPVAADGKIFIVAPDRYLTAIDAKTGKTVWRSNRFMVRETIGISENGKQIYAESMQDTVIAVSTKADKFDLLWATDCGYGYDIAPSMVIEKNGTLFFSTKNGLIFALNSINGRVIWRYKFGNTLINTVAPVNSKKVLFSNFDGKIGLLTGFD